MAFPFIFEEDFEDAEGDVITTDPAAAMPSGATRTGFDSESDTGGKLSVVSYRELARTPGAPMPFRGAYLLRNELGDTNDHVVIEGDIDIADGNTRWLRFYLYIGDDFAFTANDTFNIYEHQQAGGTIEAVISLKCTAATDVIEIGLGESEAAVFGTALARGRWYCIELSSVAVTGATSSLYVDDA